MKVLKATFIVIAFCFVNASIVSASPVTDAGEQYTHEVSWGGWNENSEKKLPVKIYLDGQDIGTVLQAYKELDSLFVTSKDRIKLDVPPAMQFDNNSRFIYMNAKFLRTWSSKGVKLAIFKGSEGFEVHTLTWTWDPRISDTLDPDWDNAQLIYDNQDIGKRAQGLQNLRSKHWKSHTALLILLPYGSTPFGAAPYPRELERTSDQIKDKYGVVVQYIVPNQ